jgi:hypothetical protein
MVYHKDRVLEPRHNIRPHCNYLVLDVANTPPQLTHIIVQVVNIL